MKEQGLLESARRVQMVGGIAGRFKCKAVWLAGTKFWDKVIVSALEARRRLTSSGMGFTELILESWALGQ